MITLYCSFLDTGFIDFQGCRYSNNAQSGDFPLFPGRDVYKNVM